MNKCKNFTEWTKEDFEKIPLEPWDSEIGEFTDVVIVPNDYIHDSGYKCMEFVLRMKDGSFRKVGGGCDVIHLDGVGGFGPFGERYPQTVRESKSWNMDCLPCGYLRLWCSGYRLSTSQFICSDFEVYAEARLE